MNKIKSSILLILLSFTINSISEELNLSCLGSVEATQISSEKIETAKSKAFIKIDLETNVFSIEDYPLMSTTLDPSPSALIFLASDSKFAFTHRYKNSSKDVLSSIEINRYTGKLNIYELLLNQGGMLIVKSDMDCTTATKRKF